MALRLRDIPAIPLLIILHLIFTLSSLLVRIAEGLQRRDTSSPSSSTNKPPRHIGVVLSSRTDPKRPTSPERQARQRRAVVESLLRVVQWASEEGTTELSIWDGHGLLQRYEQEILDVLLLEPPSPDSDPATPSPTNASLPAQDLSDEVTICHASTHTVYGSTPKPITLHLLHPSASDVVADLTRRYMDQKRSPESITQKSLDADIRNALGFKVDPDLLIVHALEAPSFFRALLPRPPPELHGYPFWPLRITEIYQHRTPLPIPTAVSSLLAMLLARAQVSSLPLVRKTARWISLDDPSGGYRRIPGALTVAQWEGAMSAWSKVEQRLGK